MFRDIYTAYYSDNESTYSFTDGESVDDVDALADEVDLKFCTGCQDFKIKNDFHKDKTTKYGVKSQCKECKKKASATYIEKIAKKNVINTDEVDIIDSVDEDQRSCCIFPYFGKIWNS
tara:strand:- start:1153 stop:1506 length:354 start_codon:yes stop_codon:yes gene_type:complete